MERAEVYFPKRRWMGHLKPSGVKDIYTEVLEAMTSPKHRIKVVPIFGEKKDVDQENN